MYFFRIEISSFDDAAETLYVIPEQNADEQGIPFEEKILTQTAGYKAFIKENATSMVDGIYTQYKCEERLECVTEETFAQLQAEGKLEQLDSNSFSISTSFKPKKSGGKKDMKMYLIIGVFAIALVVLMIVSAAVGGKNDDTTSSVESSESVESTENSEPESSEDSTSISSEESSTETTTSSLEPVFVDEPPEETSETSDVTNENGYTDVGYTKTPTTASSSNIGGVYSIYFNANGGEGSLESISSEAGQYVVLPRAETAAKSITKKGYKLIGFSDNTEIPYPLYEYSHVDGCTYGYSDRKQTGEFGTIKYFGDTEYKFTENTTLYRVLNEYGGGTGTRENPYIISYYDQLIRLSEQKASGCFLQTADIKFPSNIERKPIDTKEISRGYENKSYDFFVYDGGNFKIKNLRGKGGLFGKTAGSTIKNVNIEDADISAAGYSNVGFICNEIASYSFKSVDGVRDYATGNSKIISCSVQKSKIDGDKAKNVGGICGYGGVISDCFVNEVAITDGENVGGIVGNACSVTGSLANGVTTDGTINSAGGIAGTAIPTLKNILTRYSRKRSRGALSLMRALRRENCCRGFRDQIQR